MAQKNIKRLKRFFLLFILGPVFFAPFCFSQASASSRMRDSSESELQRVLRRAVKATRPDNFQTVYRELQDRLSRISPPPSNSHEICDELHRLLPTPPGLPGYFRPSSEENAQQEEPEYVRNLRTRLLRYRRYIATLNFLHAWGDTEAKEIHKRLTADYTGNFYQYFDEGKPTRHTPIEKRELYRFYQEMGAMLSPRNRGRIASAYSRGTAIFPRNPQESRQYALPFQFLLGK